MPTKEPSAIGKATLESGSKSKITTPRQQKQHIFTEADELSILNILLNMLDMDMKFITEERKHLKKDDPRRNKMSLGLKQFSLPYGIPPNIIPNLEEFFKKKRWQIVKITASPSIKLEKIPVKHRKNFQPKKNKQRRMTHD